MAFTDLFRRDPEKKERDAKKKNDTEKLAMWQERFDNAESRYNAKLCRMDEREKLYRGEAASYALTEEDSTRCAPHVRNICAEFIEAQVNSGVPQPKVTAMRKEDEEKARIIEDMLRSELDRLPSEEIGDMMERTVPVQGGGFLLCEWDNTERTHTTVGELVISALHPKQVIPQDGIYVIEDMDYIFVKIPQTRDYIYRRFGVDVSGEAETDPDVRGLDEAAADDLVTEIDVYYRNDVGGIGRFSFVGDTILCDLDDYQARRTKKCASCGAPEPSDAEKKNDDSVILDGDEDKKPKKKVCPKCGGTRFVMSDDDFEEVITPIERRFGEPIPGEHPAIRMTEGEVKDGEGLQTAEIEYVPTKIPYYKPNVYPITLQKSVSVYGQFLGDSDIDKIESQQKVINRMETKIIEKLISAGSYLSLPNDCTIDRGTDEMKIIRPDSAADMTMIKVFDMEGNISQDISYLAQVYEEAKQAIGVTDSYLGRIDRTATSGKAKEFSASQSAGRLESKRVMKNAAWSHLFEIMFKFKLAYADEPRPIRSRDIGGDVSYSEFNRYDFLERDENGEWYWNDRFLFSCDVTAPLASNREAMWQETRGNLQSGAFGDPTDIKTLIMFWTKMDELHYPGAGEVKRYLEDKLQAQMSEQVIAQAQADAQRQIEGEENQMMQRTVLERARADAERDAAAQITR